MKDSKQAWTKQKALQDQEERPTPEQVRTIIDNIQHPETQTLVSLLYLLGCRLTEIIGEERRTIWEREWEEVTDKRGDKVKRRIGKYTKRGHIHPKLRKITPNDFTKTYRDEHPFILAKIHNRKHRSKNKKSIPINLGDEIDCDIWTIIKKYMSTKKGDAPLFDFGKSKAYKLIMEHTHYNPHWWRHIRLTHLIIKYNLNERLLIKYAGWTDGRPAESYMELYPSDIMDAFVK